MNPFSYKEYNEILHLLRENYPIMDFSEIGEETKTFAVIRHDVEFSIERAYQMAEFEAEKEIFTSYMFQIRNNAYNIFSSENINMIRDIHEMGHNIGLHVHLGMLNNLEQLSQYILTDLQVMEKFLQIPVDRFSYHRPSKEVLRRELKLKNFINTYDDKFFDFKADFHEGIPLRIKYFADSMHRWEYGYPSQVTIKDVDKVQLLIHPYSWTEEGFNNRDNFKSLIKEKVEVFKSTLKSETNHYTE